MSLIIGKQVNDVVEDCGECFRIVFVERFLQLILKDGNVEDVVLLAGGIVLVGKDNGRITLADVRENLSGVRVGGGQDLSDFRRESRPMQESLCCNNCRACRLSV